MAGIKTTAEMGMSGTEAVLAWCKGVPRCEGELPQEEWDRRCYMWRLTSIFSGTKERPA